jgi:hypothetical protein
LHLLLVRLFKQFLIFFDMENYPQWVNNLVYFLAGIGFGHILFNFITGIALPNI